MNSTRSQARVAGGLYLLSAVMAGAPLIYVSGSLIVPGDAAATAHHILASETWFRLSIVSELTGALVFIFTAGALYRLLHNVNRMQAATMVVLVLLSVPISFVNVLNEIVALTLLRGDTFLSTTGQPRREVSAMLFLGLHGDGANLANIFWGLWLFPFGLLVIKSGFIPRILGVLLIVNGCALLIVSFTALLSPAYLDVVSRFAILPELGELWMMGWLLVKGVKKTAHDATALSATAG